MKRCLYNIQDSFIQQKLRCGILSSGHRQMQGSLSTVKHLVLKKIWHNLHHGRNLRAICSVKPAQVLQGSAYVKWLPESHRDREVGWPRDGEFLILFSGWWPRAGEEGGGGCKTPWPCHCWEMDTWDAVWVYYAVCVLRAWNEFRCFPLNLHFWTSL